MALVLWIVALVGFIVALFLVPEGAEPMVFAIGGGIALTVWVSAIAGHENDDDPF
ncbi:MAG: hypothetical protein LBE15_04020 [Burkholderiales bacterium]|jgi:peptidoglycan/LPS O-acetylase OafA/YrhL|nr:hypothetical protein [Burkholderiales bacterium]